MSKPNLEQAITDLARLATRWSVVDLERTWKWASYDEEGVRFVFFRTMEELRTLAVRLAQIRLTTNRPPSQAQHILAQYHAAYRDLQAAVLGLDEAGFTTPPAEDEWPVRQTLAHILGADVGFYGRVRYTLEHKLASGRPEDIPTMDRDRLLGLGKNGYEALLDSPADELLAYHTAFHARVIAEFSQIGDAELGLDSYYWEDEPHPLRFRLHRFESHLRQHTVQIDKTLAAIGRLPDEPLRLMRLIYAALAEVEGILIGAEDLGIPLIEPVAASIASWILEIS